MLFLSHYFGVFKAKCLKYRLLRYVIRQLLSSSSVTIADFTKWEQRCNTGSKIKNGYTLYVFKGISEKVYEVKVVTLAVLHFV